MARKVVKVDVIHVSGITLDEHLRRVRERRWKSKSKEERQAAAAHAVHAYWGALSLEQRSAEMKRRAAKRKKRRKPKKK